MVNKKQVVCSLCKAKIGYSGKTSNLFAHLSNRHKDVNLLRPKTASKQNTIKINDGAFAPVESLQKIAPSGSHAVAITASIVNFIAEDLRRISIVEGSGFRENDGHR